MHKLFPFILLIFFNISLFSNEFPSLYLNNRQVSTQAYNDNLYDIKCLSDRLSGTTKSGASNGPNDPNKPDELHFYHIFNQYYASDSLIILEDGSSWKSSWWYNSVPKKWKQGDRLKISVEVEFIDKSEYYIKIENIDTPGIVWGSWQTLPDVSLYITKIGHYENQHQNKITLSNGLVFKSYREFILELGWRVHDRVFIFHQEGAYGLLAYEQKLALDRCTLISLKDDGLEENKSKQPFTIPIERVLNLQENLNKKVVDQEEASQAVYTALLNHFSGLKLSEGPIGVFLFAGPSGVGKTEFAKALCEELFESKTSIIRLDMSQFNTKWTVTRLIGSAPGYVDSDKGGQLTGALLQNPNTVVLLDEIEKADPEVLKFFLPVFDEGYIMDAQNNRVDCKNAIFILTSNLFAQKIKTSFSKGKTAEEVLHLLEPQFMESLSPELYNRLTAIMFRPLTPKSIEKIVDIFLRELVKKVKELKKVDLVVDDSVREYLIFNGYHPELGARPLKRLIEKDVINNLSIAFITNTIPEGSKVTISYAFGDKKWHVNWENL